MIDTGTITIIEIRRLTDALILHAAVEAASLDTPHPSLQQIVDKYNVLVKAVDPTPPPRPVADPSKYTANVVGG